MRKLRVRVRPIYVAVAGAIAGAEIAIPAWAASGGDDSSDQGSAGRAPLPPPPGAAGFGVAFKGAPSAADAKLMRQKLDEFTSCMRKYAPTCPTFAAAGGAYRSRCRVRRRGR
jgi:hypothetical protein